MLPIAILPVAGLLLGIGSSFTNETTIATYGLQKILGDGTVLHALLTIMNKVGSAVFDNLPLILRLVLQLGWQKNEKEVAALSALIAYFVMNVAINGMLVVTGEITADGQIAKDVLEGTIASVCGIQSLQMGVFGGIIVGLGVAALHNRFPQNCTSECIVIFWRFQIRSDYLYNCVYVCGNWHVFCVAAGSERHLCAWRISYRKRICRNLILVY